MIGSGSGMLARVCVVLGGRGRDGTMMVADSWWKKGGVAGRKEKEGRSASYCLSLGGYNCMGVVDKCRVSYLVDSLLLLHWWWWRMRENVSEMLKKR